MTLELFWYILGAFFVLQGLRELIESYKDKESAPLLCIFIQLYTLLIANIMALGIWHLVNKNG